MITDDVFTNNVFSFIRHNLSKATVMELTVQGLEITVGLGSDTKTMLISNELIYSLKDDKERLKVVIDCSERNLAREWIEEKYK